MELLDSPRANSLIYRWIICDLAQRQHSISEGRVRAQGGLCLLRHLPVPATSIYGCGEHIEKPQNCADCDLLMNNERGMEVNFCRVSGRRQPVAGSRASALPSGYLLYNAVHHSRSPLSCFSNLIARGSSTRSCNPRLAVSRSAFVIRGSKALEIRSADPRQCSIIPSERTSPPPQSSESRFQQ